MKSCLSLAFAVLLTASLAAQTTAPNAPAPNDKDKDKEPAKCIVAGQVVQEPGGRPIRKATIQLTPVDQEAGTTYSADTDAEGHFKIDNIKPGQYGLWVGHGGFSSMAKRRGGRSLTLDPGQEMKDLVFRMQPAAVITGKIVDNDGDPVSGRKSWSQAGPQLDRRLRFRCRIHQRSGRVPDQRSSRPGGI